MNAKKIWATICFLFAGISTPIAYTKLRLPDHSTERISAGLFAVGFWLLIGLLLWRQGQEQKPIQPPVPTRENET